MTIKDRRPRRVAPGGCRVIMRPPRVLFVVAYWAWTSVAAAQLVDTAASPSGAYEKKCGCEEEPAREHVIEVTFGTAQLFNRESVSTDSGSVDGEVIPVSSALLMTEWLFMPQLSLVGLATLPLEEQAVLVDGELRYEFAAPSLALGVRGTLYGFQAFWDSTVELQLAAFGGRTLGSSSGDRFFPLLAGRLHVRTREGFALYIGGAYAFERVTAALIYGIGHRF